MNFIAELSCTRVFFLPFLILLKFRYKLLSFAVNGEFYFTGLSHGLTGNYEPLKWPPACNELTSTTILFYIAITPLFTHSWPSTPSKRLLNTQNPSGTFEFMGGLATSMNYCCCSVTVQALKFFSEVVDCYQIGAGYLSEEKIEANSNILAQEVEKQLCSRFEL